MVTHPYLAAVSVDLDEIDCYHAIHGLPPPSAATRHAVFDRTLPRFEALFDRLGIRGTFFTIGRDLGRSSNAQAVKRLHHAGHEIGNHSANHLYDLTRQDPQRMLREVSEGAACIRETVGVSPVGFRAPGYTMTTALSQLLQQQEYAYDSSVFPCPTYYAAKITALAALRARGRRSHSVVDDPRVLWSSADPYKTGRPYWALGDGILELPIGVTHGSSGRLPYIGTSLVLAGARGARWLTQHTLGRPLVNLELHGIDLADAETDGLQSLRPHQPDLRRPLQQKLEALEAAITLLQGSGYRFVTLAQAAQRFDPSSRQ